MLRVGMQVASTSREHLLYVVYVPGCGVQSPAVDAVGLLRLTPSQLGWLYERGRAGCYAEQAELVLRNVVWARRVPCPPHSSRRMTPSAFGLEAVWPVRAWVPPNPTSACANNGSALAVLDENAGAYAGMGGAMVVVACMHPTLVAFERTPLAARWPPPLWRVGSKVMRLLLIVLFDAPRDAANRAYSELGRRADAIAWLQRERDPFYRERDAQALAQSPC